jgi:hypothetical protein
VSSIQKVKGHIIVWDVVVPPHTHNNRYIPCGNLFIYLLIAPTLINIAPTFFFVNNNTYDYIVIIIGFDKTF